MDEIITLLQRDAKGEFLASKSFLDSSNVPEESTGAVGRQLRVRQPIHQRTTDLKKPSSEQHAISVGSNGVQGSVFNEIKREPSTDETTVGLDATEEQFTNHKQPSSDQHMETVLMREPIAHKTIVGFEEAIEQLIKNLKQPSSELEVISIIGMAGLGKTTVASKIYNDPKIAFEFPARIWINVSEECVSKDIYLTILKKFTNQTMSDESESRLIEKVREYLSLVKFLLVADDVWTPEAWKAIKIALPRENIRGKVLITSRNDQVAKCANPTKDPHRLPLLNFEESWKLLQLEVYGRVDPWPKDLEVIGQLIAKRCDGLPLSLVVMGGIMSDKTSDSISDTKTEWKKVSTKVDEYLLEGDEEGNIVKIISLSYLELPYSLRDCFLYLGTFPEDYEISAWKLTRMWISEGFIKEKDATDQSVEDVAEENLNELIKRNLVMVVKKNVRGQAKTVRVHDVIRHFCKKEAKGLDGFQEIRFLATEGRYDPPLSDIEKFRRVSLHSFSADEFFNKKPNCSAIRSFICFSKESVHVTLKNLARVITRFKEMRVFEGSGLKFPIFAPELAQLIHLRYIAFSAGKNFKNIPDSIFNLLSLETIAITTSSTTLQINHVSGLKSLRHLKTNSTLVVRNEEKTDAAASEKLQTLSRLSAGSCNDKVLSKTPNLKTLGIRGDLDPIFNTTCLKNLECLSQLKLTHDTESKKPSSGLPISKFFPPNMKSLTLAGTHLNWIDMNILGSLPNLETLKLKDFAFMGELYFAKNGFHSLEYLYIDRSDLTLWTVSENSFEKLEYLVIKNCEKLLNIPDGLVKKLKLLEVERVTRDAVIFTE